MKPQGCSCCKAELARIGEGDAECLISLFLSPIRMWFLFSGEGRLDTGLSCCSLQARGGWVWACQGGGGEENARRSST